MANYDTRRVLDYRFGQLSASVTALDTTMQSTAFTTLAADLSAEKYIPVIIADDALGLYEVVWLTAHSASSQSVTVVRGREGSTARAWASGTLFRIAPTIRDVLSTVATRGALPSDAHVGMRLMVEDEDAVVERVTSGWERVANKPFGHVGRTAGFQTVAQAANGAYVQFDTAQELAGGVTLDNATDALVVPLAGRYRITVHGYYTGATTAMCVVEATINSTATPPSFAASGPAAGARVTSWKETGADFVITSSVVRRLAANDKIRLWVATPDSTYGTDGYNGSWLELEYVGA